MTCVEFFVCVLLAVCVSGEVYTSSTQLKSLLKGESYLAATIDAYIVAEKARLQTLSRRAAEYRAHGERLTTDERRATFVKHPVNVFVLIRRLTTDWHDVVNIMQDSSSANRYLNEIVWSAETSDIRFATETDLEGAARAIAHLQSFYGLRASDVAAGRIAALPPADERMTGADCAYVGALQYNDAAWAATVDWMGAAVELLEADGAPPSAVTAALHCAVGALYSLGRVSQALTLNARLLRIEPKDASALKNRAVFELPSVRAAAVKYVLPPDDPAHPHFGRDACRGGVARDAAVTSKLYCFYKSNEPYLRLAPFKAELLNDAPLVAVFHDVLSPAEMATVKQLAEPFLNRAFVASEETAEPETSEGRTTQNAWLMHQSDETVRRIRRRLALMTGLSMQRAEHFQVADYGIGGHYSLHPDHASAEDMDLVFDQTLDRRVGGNRIATVLFYLSEPEVGGFTVFPDLNLALKPKAGSAAFWYNLARDGEGLTDMWHAACAVLYGAKWVANSWIHEYGQELRRPCPLDKAAVYTSADL